MVTRSPQEIVGELDHQRLNNNLGSPVDEETKHDLGTNLLMEAFPNAGRYAEEAKPKVYEANFNNGNISFSYEGHITQEIQELLTELREVDNPTYSDRIGAILRRFSLNVDQFCEKHFDWKHLKITKEDLLLWIFVITIGIVYTVQLVVKSFPFSDFLQPLEFVQ